MLPYVPFKRNPQSLLVKDTPGDNFRQLHIRKTTKNPMKKPEEIEFGHPFQCVYRFHNLNM